MNADQIKTLEQYILASIERLKAEGVTSYENLATQRRSFDYWSANNQVDSYEFSRFVRWIHDSVAAAYVGHPWPQAQSAEDLRQPDAPPAGAGGGDVP